MVYAYSRNKKYAFKLLLKIKNSSKGIEKSNQKSGQLIYAKLGDFYVNLINSNVFEAISFCLNNQYFFKSI